MSDTHVLVLVGVLGAMCAFVERRDGWRFARLTERLDREVADLRERVALLERDREDDGPGEPEPRPWWAFWRAGR